MSLEIRNIRFAQGNSKTSLFDVICEDGRVSSIRASGPEVESGRSESVVNGEGGLLLPS